MITNELKSQIVELVKEQCLKEITQLLSLGARPIPQGCSVQFIIDFFDKELSYSDIEIALVELTEEGILSCLGRDYYIYSDIQGRRVWAY